MAGRGFAGGRRPDLPGLPPDLSVDELARVERFLSERDVRRPYNDHLADFIGPPADRGPDVLVGGDAVVKSGEILTASGHRANAVLILDPAPLLEHWDTMFLFPILSASQGREPDVARWATVAHSDEGFASAVESLRAHPPYEDLEPFPFAYRYFDTDLWPEDPHVDATTGWSENGRQVMDRVVRRALSEGRPKAP